MFLEIPVPLHSKTLTIHGNTNFTVPIQSASELWVGCAVCSSINICMTPCVTSCLLHWGAPARMSERACKKKLAKTRSLRCLMSLLMAPRISCLGQPPSFCVVPCPWPLSAGTRDPLHLYRHCSPEGSHQSYSLTFYRR